MRATVRHRTVLQSIGGKELWLCQRINDHLVADCPLSVGCGPLTCSCQGSALLRQELKTHAYRYRPSAGDHGAMIAEDCLSSRSLGERYRVSWATSPSIKGYPL
jgi:hypothetical protein